MGLHDRMSETKNRYENPLVDRYASADMSYIWSPQKKFSTWRRLWVALARAERELGVDTITEAQITQMEACVEDIDFERAEKIERETRHDVMSHVHAFGEQCPEARPIIHLGATSCYVTDNTELCQIRESLQIVKQRLIRLIRLIRDHALDQHKLPTLAFTHYQPAQLTTVGKRMAMWLQDIVFDFEEVQRLHTELPFRGVKGTTGTQATFLALFNGDGEKVRQLDRLVSEQMDFNRTLPITGQTYSRKIDYRVLSTLSGIAQSCHKTATDIRLLMNLKEVDEPFSSKQVGSSAMAYKRNPMRSERICSLARYIMSLTANASNTHATQWLERSLDDSANRRLSLPEAFLATDVILQISANVMDGFRVWPKMIRKHIDEELPYMATEAILMACVTAGGDRQELHEAIRVHSIASAQRVKDEGVENDLFERIAGDALFAEIHDRLDSFASDPSQFIGRAPEQVTEFVAEVIDPLLAEHECAEAVAEDVSV
jgi:adenylosuccinate lyase